MDPCGARVPADPGYEAGAQRCLEPAGTRKQHRKGTAASADAGAAAQDAEAPRVSGPGYSRCRRDALRSTTAVRTVDWRGAWPTTVVALRVCVRWRRGPTEAGTTRRSLLAGGPREAVPTVATDNPSCGLFRWVRCSGEYGWCDSRGQLLTERQVLQRHGLVAAAHQSDESKKSRLGGSGQAAEARGGRDTSRRQTRLIAAQRVDGLHGPAVFNGLIDTPTFLAYVEQELESAGSLAEPVHSPRLDKNTDSASSDTTSACGPTVTPSAGSMACRLTRPPNPRVSTS